MHQNCYASDTKSFSSIEGTEWSYALVFATIGFYEGKVWSCCDGDCLIYGGATYTDYSYTISNRKGEKAFGILIPFLGIGLRYDQTFPRVFPFYFISPKMHTIMMIDKEFEPVCLAGWRNQDGEFVSDYYYNCPEGDNCTCGNYENL
jgi:hypothetical protein